MLATGLAPHVQMVALGLTAAFFRLPVPFALALVDATAVVLGTADPVWKRLACLLRDCPVFDGYAALFFAMISGFAGLGLLAIYFCFNEGLF